MDKQSAKKLAKLLEFEQKLKTNPAVAVLSEIETVIQDTSKTVNEVKQELITTQDGVVEIAQKVNDIEQSLDSKINRKVESKVSSIPPVIGPRGFKGDPGNDYIITPKDYAEIAKKVAVPVVEKIIEKTEVIKEQPVIKTEIVKETTIKEDLTGESIVNKINDLPLTDDKKIDASHIKNLTKTIAGSYSVGVSETRVKALIAETPAGASTFTSLTDTPNSYTGGASKAVYVKADETGLEFKDAASPELAVDINRYGFLNQTETTISFDGTSVFTLGSVGVSWSYYRAGIKNTITGNKTIDLTTIDATLVDGATYFIYIDGTEGTLVASRVSPWTLNDTKVPVATIVWNNTLTPKYQLADERHSCLIDRRDHYYQHFTIGARVKSVGALGGTYTVGTDTDAAKTFSIAESVFLDEDIIVTCDSLTEPNGNNADYVVMYRTSASTWAWKASAMPFVYNTSTNWIQWDNGGTLTDATGGSGSNTRWVNSYLLLTNYNGAARFVFIPSQAIFTSLATAQAENPAAFTFTGLPIVETAICYRLTWTTITSTSKGKCRLAATPQRVFLGSVSSTSVGTTINDHGLLSGLTDDDHPQYILGTRGLSTDFVKGDGSLDSATGTGLLQVVNGVLGKNVMITVSATAPSNPQYGDLWVDLS
jgi:hypothetical protein